MGSSALVVVRSKRKFLTKTTTTINIGDLVMQSHGKRAVAPFYWRGECVEDERLWQEVRDLRAELRELRNMYLLFSERMRVVEIARENSQLRHTNMPGWIIAGIGVLVAAVSVLMQLWLAGRLP